MKFESKVDVLIIGAGASGMMAAVSAARTGASVLVLDGNEKAGKKIYATGNGRCNLTNLHCSPEGFNRPEDGFVKAVLNQFSAEDTIGFFREMGMLTRVEQEGRCYPYSGQAAAVVSFLEKEMARLHVECLLGDRAVSAESAGGNGEESGGSEASGSRKRDGSSDETDASQNDELTDSLFITTLESGRMILSRTLIIACGGKAGPHFGSTGDGYGLARRFGHTLEAPRPALVGCVSGDPMIRSLRGRARASVTLYENGTETAREQGEVQFTGMGISGICVMDLTRFMEAPRPARKKKKSGKRSETEAAVLHNNKFINIEQTGRYSSDKKPLEKHYEIHADLAPDLSADEVREVLEGSIKRGESLENALSGILNSNTAKAFADYCGGTEDAVRMIKELRIPVESTLGWKDAQVSCGGVRREEIQKDSLESLLVPGLYFCGEVLDADGRCGGYNLQWAWSSGFVSGRSAAAGASASS